MRVLVAGATGVVGRRLTRRLIAAGHEVIGLTRSPERAGDLAAAGAQPVLCDVLEDPRLAAVLRQTAPEVLVCALSELPQVFDVSRWAEMTAASNRLRREGTQLLMDAAAAAGVRRAVALSVAFLYDPEGPGGPPQRRSEEAPLLRAGPAELVETARACAALERAVAEGSPAGVVLRCGVLYGPGTWYAPDGSIAALVRAGRYPIGGQGTGVTSFVHVEDAAAALASAVEGTAGGVFNIVDDEPARQDAWLPEYARSLGARSPTRLSEEQVRRAAGDPATFLATRQCGADNTKAKGALGWQPAYPTWRRGFYGS